MNPTEFHQQAASVFKGAWVKTSVEICTGERETRYAVTVIPTDDDVAWAEAPTPADAIRKARDKVALQRENKLQAARKLLGIED